MGDSLIQSAKIFIVDDEPANVRLLEQILERHGYNRVTITTDSRRVLPMFLDDQPDLVLLDLHMPHVDGYEALAQLRAATPPEQFLPIIVLTADATPATKRRALASGATDFLCKPLDAIEVAQRIENVLRTRFLHLQVCNQNAILEERVRERTAAVEQTLQELRRTQQQIIQQERLRALGMMASGIAHDFNNALSVIMGYTELLLTENSAAPSRKTRKYLGTVLSAAQDAAQMVTRLAQFQRPSSASETRQAVKLAQLVKQAAALTMPRWRGQAMANGIDIDLLQDIGPAPDIDGDPAELREMLTNLIFNAVDALPEGGSIVLRTRTEGDFAVLEVRDTGTGMTEEVRQRCLEPFFTTKGEGGSGLGLAMIYGIVQRHGATLDIVTRPGHGTKFEIRFPSRARGKTSAQVVVAGSSVCEPLKVLAVDDQPELCEILAEYLRCDWHEVTTAANGDEALRIFDSEKFDLVITDKAMPGMSGDQLAAAVRMRQPRVPVILLTGFGEPGIGEALPAGIDLVIAKPVNLTTLRQAIARVTSSAGATAPVFPAAKLEPQLAPAA
jgi:signal transduction histidine kinase